MSPRGALAIRRARAEGTNPLQKIPRGPHAGDALYERVAVDIMMPLAVVDVVLEGVATLGTDRFG